MSDAHKVVFNSFAMPDDHSYGVYKALMEIYPNFAKKLFENNELMYKIVMTGYNPMDILEYPICGRCETLAVYDGVALKDGRYVSKCTCFRCGISTVKPITLKEWITMELKKKAPPDFTEYLDYAVDMTANYMLRKFISDTLEIMLEHNEKTAEAMEAPKLHKFDVKAEDQPVIVEHLGNKKPDMPEDLEEIKE